MIKVLDIKLSTEKTTVRINCKILRICAGNKNLTKKAYRVLLYLLTEVDSKNQVTIHQKEIANSLNMSKSSISLAIKNLEEENIIEYTLHGKLIKFIDKKESREMKHVKETKKYNVYEVDIPNVGEVVIKDPKDWEKGFKKGEKYATVKFENKSTGQKSQCECFQEDTLRDIENDIKLIKGEKIKGTNFYRNWMKIIFEKGEDYDLVVKGVKQIGTFIGDDTFKKNTFYFEMNGKKIEASGVKYEGYEL